MARLDRDLQLNITTPDGGKLETRMDEARKTHALALALVEIASGLIFPSTPSDDLSMSEFGERRVASPGNRADVDFSFDKQPFLMDDISSGGGTATHNTNSRDVRLAIVNTTANTVAGMRLHYWVPYTPGSGQEIDITGTIDEQNQGGTMQVFLRSTVGGTTTLQTINQGNWSDANTGVDWSKSQIFRMSFQSLRVGRIQFSLVRNGVVTKVYEITNDNLRATGYWQYATLPPYWKMVNTADNLIVEFGYGDELNGIGFRYVMSKSAAATARAICCTVKSQGGDRLLDMDGLPFATPILAAKTVSNTLIPILSIRAAATYNSLPNRTLILPTGYSLSTTNPLDYVLLFRPTLTNPSWVANDATYSAVEYDVTASAVTGGVRIDRDMLGAGNNARIASRNILERVIMALGSTGTADILTLAAIRVGSVDAAVTSALKWEEIR